MSAREHEIDDWHRPRLPPWARALNALPRARVARWLPLDGDALIERARAQSGLDDLGDDDFREPFELLIADLRDDPGLTPLGRVIARTIFGHLLTARLRVEHLGRERPHATAGPGGAPIVIVGLPRTGTTHLHNLLARIPALRSLPWWESVTPIADPRARGPDLRRARARLELAELLLLPLLPLMHEMAVDLPHEELQLSAIAFRSFFFEGSFRLPRYRPWYAGSDHRCGYRYLRRVLELLEPPATGRRWVLKSPQHVDQLDALLDAFPEALIVRTHRDPARAILSLATMVTYTRRACYDDVDPPAEGRAWAKRLTGMLTRGVELGDRIPRERLLDIAFRDIVDDPLGTVARIADAAGLALDEPARRAVTRHVETHPRGRLGTVRYRPEPLGLDLDALRAELAPYTTRFCVPVEG